MVEQANARPDNAVNIENPNERDPLRPIRERFQVLQTFWQPIHDEALEDDKFVSGEQWPPQVKAEREEEGRPCLTYNFMPSFTRQIINKIRQERPQLKIRPVETDRAQLPNIKNVQGSQDYSMADIYSGIVRNIEYLSHADQAYDTAVGHAVDHSFGYFYVMPRWARSDPFVQELTVRRVKDSYSILLDAGAQEADYSDMQDAFMFTHMNRLTFERKYPEAVADGAFTMGTGETFTGWWDPDKVRIAQYFWIEYRSDEVLALSNGKTVYYEDVKEILDELEEDEGIHILKDARGRELRKAVKRPICRWRKFVASGDLEGPLDLPFETIPIFPVLGDERLVDGVVKYESAHRHARDAQRSYNYWRTAAAETAALAPRAPWLMTEDQMRGHEDEFENANRENLAALTYNHVEGQPAPARQFAKDIPYAELQLSTQDANDIQTIIGLHQANLGAESNEKSGRAIERRQQQGLTSTFQFPDNLARAQEAMGRALVFAIPRIYDTRRIMRIRLPDDTEDFVEINQTVTDKDSGKQVIVHDLGVGRYDVVMETGIDYATQRAEAIDVQLGILDKIGPDLAANIVHLVVENIGGPGADRISAVLRKLLPDELKTDEERAKDLPSGIIIGEQGQPIVEETGQPWQPPETPQQRVAMAQAQLETAKQEAEKAGNEAKGKDAEARIIVAQSKIKEAEAKMAELERSGTAGQARDDSQFLADVERIVKDVMAAHEGNENAHKKPIQMALTDQTVEILERVKAYVDRKLPEASSSSSRPAASSTPAAAPTPVVVSLSDEKAKRPNAIKFNYNDQGELEGAELEDDTVITIVRRGDRMERAIVERAAE